MNLLENAVVQEQRRIEYMIKKYETELTTVSDFMRCHKIAHIS